MSLRINIEEQSFIVETNARSFTAIYRTIIYRKKPILILNITRIPKIRKVYE